MNPIDWRLDVLPVLVGLAIPTLALGVLVAARPVGEPELRRRWRLRALVVVAALAVLGLIVTMVLVDTVNVLGVPVGPLSRAGIAFGVALAGLGVSTLVAGRRYRTGTWRRAVAVALVPLALLTAAAAVNTEVGALRTLAQLFPPPVAADGAGLPAKAPTAAEAVTAAEWTPPDDLPASGSVVSVDIPGTVSGFAARPAVVYLPPAALVADPPTLPVVVMLSGQPGQPVDVLQSGRFQAALDAFAAAHGGLAPIVVSPDQLGSPDANPMCVDGPLGDAATYLTVDVHDWIVKNLNVAGDRLAWTFGGYSEGGTCAYQLGLADPREYGTTVSISGELEPSLNEDAAATLATGFGGDQAAYDAAKPLNIIAAHRPYTDTVLIQGVGEKDAVYRGWAQQIESAATGAGIRVTTIVSPGTSHDFNTVDVVLRQALPAIMARSGTVPA